VNVITKRDEPKDPWDSGHFTQDWYSQDVMDDTERLARVRVQRDYRGRALWIRLYPLKDIPVAGQSYVVTVRTFDSEWLHWRTTVFGPFDTSEECDEFQDTLPKHLIEDEHVEISFSILQKSVSVLPGVARELDFDF